MGLHTRRRAMATYTFLLNSLAAGNEDERRYPHLRSSRHKRSLLFVVAASSLAIAASVVVAGIVAFKTPEAARTYGEQHCAPGHSMYRLPIINYASCCSHYTTTCCNLHSSSCENKFEFLTGAAISVAAGADSTHPARATGGSSMASAADGTSGHGALGGVATSHRPVVRAPRHSAHCELVLSLLSCARCSPFAGHYVNSATLLMHKPNITVCESFCKEAYEACAPPESERDHVRFCSEQLGVHVGLSTRSSGDDHHDATCFSAGHVAAQPVRWLSLGATILVSLIMARGHVGG